MDYTSQNAMLGMLAALRAARRQATDSIARATAEGDSGGLIDVLQNPNFLTRRAGDSDVAGGEEDSRYDDLPALEDDAPPSTSRTTRVAARLSPQANDSPESSDEDDLPALESASSPSSSQRSARDNLSSARSSLSVGEATSSDAAGPSTRALGRSEAAFASRALSGESPATSSPRPVSRPGEDDAGEESDDSMPPLQTVSDSSEESDSYFDSDPDWDDSEDYDSMADSDEYIPPVETRPDHPSAPPSEPFLRRPTLLDLLPDAREDAFPTYRDILERARSVLPDIGERFNQEVLETLAGQIESNDPVRAETLLAGMEAVPEDLVRRYEKLRMADGEDGDGCAICRDDLLDKSVTEMGLAETEVMSIYAALPYHPEPASIVAFPCPGKHLFHSECLSPWLARKTTCPSCRFDIDPHSLTLKRIREGHRIGLIPPNQQRCEWRPPQVESMRDWIDAEERARQTGVSRERPEVIMPDYPTHSWDAAPLFSPTTEPALGQRSGPSGFPADASLATLLDSPSVEWNYDPETGSFDLDAAHRDIQEMRQRFRDAEAQRHQLEDYILRELLPAVERTSSQTPPRPSSVPPTMPFGTITSASPFSVPLSTMLPSQSSTGGGETPPRRAAPIPRSPAWDGPSRSDSIRFRMETAAFGDEEPHGERVSTSSNVDAESLSRLYNGEMVSMPMPPPSDGPGSVERYTRLQQRMHALTQDLRRIAHTRTFPSVPTAFEDFVGGFEASVQATPQPPVPQPTGPATTAYPGSGAQSAAAPSAASPLTVPFFTGSVTRQGASRSAHDAPTSSQAHNAATSSSHPEPVFVRMSLPLGGRLHPQPAATVPPTPNAFDSAEAPPPIQADANNSLQAMAPLVLDADYMHALLNTGLVDPPPSGEAPPPPASSWADDLD
ncbi:hypothetical protein OH77DRAFT_1422488 [Trametes cingulata]|nr:hypothetical protein OH77DRAFT_1422488 [Trametes cingulata]